MIKKIIKLNKNQLELYILKLICIKNKLIIIQKKNNKLCQMSYIFIKNIV